MPSIDTAMSAVAARTFLNSFHQPSFQAEGTFPLNAMTAGVSWVSLRNDISLLFANRELFWMNSAPGDDLAYKLLLQYQEDEVMPS